MTKSVGIQAANTGTIGVDALFQYAGTGVQFFSGMIFYLIIVRMFSTSYVGAIAIFLGIVGLFNVLFSLGLGTAAQHFTSFHIGKGDYASVAKVFSKIVKYGFVLSLSGFISLIALAPAISVTFLHSSSYSGLVRLLSIVLLGNILFGILNGTMLGLQNFRLSALVNIAIWVVYYFGAVVLAIAVHDLNMVILGWSLGIFLGVGAELFLIERSLSRYRSSDTSLFSNYTLMMYSVPLLASGIIGYGSTYVDRFIVAGLMNLSSLGIYNFALILGASIGFLAVPFNNILMPKFSEFLGRGDRKSISVHVKSSTILLSAVYVPCALGITALGPMIINLLGGIGYESGYLPMSIILMFTAAFISQNILAQAVAAVKHTKFLVFTSLCALSANVAISFALIPYFGLVGAALGFSSVYVATFLVLALFSVREKIASFDILGLMKIWTASSIMFFSVYELRVMLFHSVLYLPFLIMVGAAIYLFLIKTMKIFSKESAEILLSIIPTNQIRIRGMIALFVES